MADVVPRTPTPASRTPKGRLASPPPLSSSDLTPPPSTQLPGKSAHLRDTLASPPTTIKPTPNFNRTLGTWKGPFPSAEEISRLPSPQARDLLQQVVPALGESRMGLAHTQLQLNLLHIEAAEAAQRAEAEHDLTRREVEMLAAGSPDLRARVALQPIPSSPMAQVQRHLESAIDQGRTLGWENAQLQRRLKQAKKVIKHLDGRNAELLEDNHRLRERIRQNRDHFNRLSGGFTPNLASPSQRNTPSSADPRARNSNPLDALLMADQILSGEPASVPSTPTPHRALRYHGHHGHVRGTHSLSSLPTTPLRNRTMTAEELIRTPINQIISTAPHVAFSAPPKQSTIATERLRHDRDSTISASEDEAITDEDVPASQASQAASHALRRYPGPSSQESPSKGKHERLVQKKLAGKVTKGGSKGVAADGEGEPRSRKRARTGERKGSVGLGIGWSSPQK